MPPASPRAFCIATSDAKPAQIVAGVDTSAAILGYGAAGATVTTPPSQHLTAERQPSAD